MQVGLRIKNVEASRTLVARGFILIMELLCCQRRSLSAVFEELSATIEGLSAIFETLSAIIESLSANVVPKLQILLFVRPNIRWNEIFSTSLFTNRLKI